MIEVLVRVRRESGLLHISAPTSLFLLSWQHRCFIPFLNIPLLYAEPNLIEPLSQLTQDCHPAYQKMLLPLSLMQAILDGEGKEREEAILPFLHIYLPTP